MGLCLLGLCVDLHLSLSASLVAGFRLVWAGFRLAGPIIPTSKQSLVMPMHSNKQRVCVKEPTPAVHSAHG